MDFDAATKYVAKNIKTVFTGTPGADVILSNASEASTSAVNALLKAGKTVGMVTEGEYKGDFICSYADFLTVKDAYILSATGISGTVNAQIISKSPTVYVPGEATENTSGFRYSNQVSSVANWNYDQAAMKLMNFDTTDDVTKADAAAGASALEADAKAARPERPALHWLRFPCNGRCDSGCDPHHAERCDGLPDTRGLPE